MNQTNDWISCSIFCPRKEWPALLCALDAFLSSGASGKLTLTRIVEFNYLYGSNIRLLVLQATDQSLSLTKQLQYLFKEDPGVQVIPGMYATSQTDNTTMLAIRVLLSDVIMAAFRIEAMNDELEFTIACYLHLTLLRNNSAAIAPLLSYAGRAILTEDPVTTITAFKAEYTRNMEVLHQMKKAVFSNNQVELPVWLPAWIAGYDTITGALPDHNFPAIYRLTVYLIIKQLGLTATQIQKLEYFIKKIAVADLIHS